MNSSSLSIRTLNMTEKPFPGEETVLALARRSTDSVDVVVMLFANGANYVYPKSQDDVNKIHAAQPRMWSRIYTCLFRFGMSEAELREYLRRTLKRPD